MHLTRSRRLVALTVASATLIAAGTVAAVAAGSSGGSAPAVTLAPRLPAVPAQAVADSRPRTAVVTLPTGAHIRVSGPAASETADLVLDGSAADAAASFLQVRMARDTYVVPSAALPYLGRQLDIRLFDVSYLARSGGGARLPLVLTAPSTGSLSLPGVSLGRTSAGTTAGTLTDASAFGRWLLQQSRSGASRLAGVGSVGLAASDAPTPPQVVTAGAASSARGPDFHTVTMRAVSRSGASTVAFGLLQNLDDPSRAAYLVEVTPGSAGVVALSVPDGNYSLVSSVLTPHPGGSIPFDPSLVADPQFTVSRDVTVTLDARPSVRYHPQVTGVHPQVQEDSFTLERTGRTGGTFVPPFSFVLLGLKGGPYGESDLFSAPSGTVTEGTFEIRTLTSLNVSNSSSVAQPADQPSYYLSGLAKQRIPATLDFTVAPTDLTAVRERVSAIRDGVSQLYFAPAVNWYQGGFAIVVKPGIRTDYIYSTDPTTESWELGYGAAGTFLRTYDAPFAAQHGATVNEDWGRYPTVPSGWAPSYEEHFLASGAPLDQTACVACRQDDNGTLEGLLAYSDATASHQLDAFDLETVPGFQAISFLRDGRLALTSDATTDGTLAPREQSLPLLPGSHRYELKVRTAGYVNPTSSTADDWTFTSSSADPTAALPAHESCGSDATRSCSWLPLLFVRYDLPLDVHDTAAAGAPFRISYSVGHQRGEPAPTGTRSTVSLSYDGGRTWTGAVTAHPDGAGGFTTTAQIPALSATHGSVALRVTATDAAGDGLTQTALGAFGLR